MLRKVQRNVEYLLKKGLVTVEQTSADIRKALNQLMACNKILTKEIKSGVEVGLGSKKRECESKIRVELKEWVPKKVTCVTKCVPMKKLIG